MIDKSELVEILRRATALIEQSEESLQHGVELMAEAKTHGLSQREIAEAIGKSVGWVNAKLRWRANGYADTAFGRQSKAARLRKKSAQSAERNTDPCAISELPESTIIQTGQVGEPVSGRHTHFGPKTLATTAPSTVPLLARSKPFPRSAISLVRRDLLISALNDLASPDPALRKQACKLVEQHRAATGMSWNDLIVPAERTASVATS